MDEPTCRACGPRPGRSFSISDSSRRATISRSRRPGQTVYPLQMWLCASCGLAQLVADRQCRRAPGD